MRSEIEIERKLRPHWDHYSPPERSRACPRPVAPVEDARPSDSGSSGSGPTVAAGGAGAVSAMVPEVSARRRRPEERCWLALGATRSRGPLMTHWFSWHPWHPWHPLGPAEGTVLETFLWRSFKSEAIQEGQEGQGCHEFGRVGDGILDEADPRRGPDSTASRPFDAPRRSAASSRQRRSPHGGGAFQRQDDRLGLGLIDDHLDLLDHVELIFSLLHQAQGDQDDQGDHISESGERDHLG